MLTNPNLRKPANDPDQEPRRVRGVRRPRRPIDGAVDTSIPDLPATLSVEDAAVVLQISRGGVLAAIHAGEIPAHRLGRSFRVLTGKLFEDPPRD